MRLSRIVTVGAVLLGALLWVADALIDYLVFYPGSFVELAFTDVPTHELWVRSLLVFLCVALGSLLAWALDRREQQAARTEHLNQVLKAIRDVNQLIVTRQSAEDLLPSACETLTSTRGYHFAWIVLTDEDGAFEALYANGLERHRQAFEERLRQSAPLPCTEAAAGGDDPAVLTDLSDHASDCPLVPLYDEHAAYVTAIDHGGTLFGYMGVSLPVERADDVEEQELFAEIAADLGLALRGIEASVQQREAEAAEARADLRYETLVETMNEGVGVCDLDGRLTWVNEAYCEMLGYECEELLGRHVSDLVVEADRPTVCDGLERRMDGGTPETYEYSFESKSGEVVPALVSAAPLWDEHGEIVGGFAVVRDLSEERAHERELELLNRVVGHSPAVAMVWEIGPGWTVSYASESVEQFGYRPEQFYSGELQFADVVHPDDLARLSQEVTDHVAADRKEFSQEYRILTAEGEVRWVDDRTWVVRDEDDEVVRFQGVLLDITERKRAEESLRESEEQYRLIAENTVDVIWKMDPDMTFTYVNQAIEDMTGYTPEEWLGSNLSDHAEPDDTAFMVQKARETMESGPPARPVILETTVLHRDGHAIPVEITARAIFDEHGRPVELQGVTRDITDRKLAEEASARSEALLRELLNATPDVAALLRPDGTVVAANDVFAERMDSTVDEIVGVCAWDRLDEPVRSERREFVEQAVATGEPARWVDERAGHWLDNRIYPVTDPDGSVTYVAVFAHDVTARRRAEEALRESEERYRELVQNANDIIYTISPEGIITSMNGAAERILGFAPDELVGRDLRDLLGAERHEEAVSHYEGKLQSGEATSTYEFELLDRDGNPVVLEINTTIHEREDEPVEVMGIARDITERKRAEEALRQRSEIISQTHDLILTTDLDGTIVDVNRAVERLTGYDREELVGRTIFDLGESPEEGATQAEILGATIEQGRWRGEIVNITASGEKVVLDCRTFLLEDARGEPQRLIGISRDVTERKQAEEALVRSEERYRGLYTSMNEGVALHRLITDDDGTPVDYRLLNVNPAYEEILGIPREQAAGMLASELYPSDAPPLLEQYARVVEENQSYTDEVYFEPFDRHFHVSAFKLRQDQFATVFEDITDRRRAEQELARSEESYRNIFNAVNDALVIHDVETGAILDANEAMSRIYGYSREEILSLRVEDVSSGVPPYDREHISEHMQKAAEGESQVFEWHARNSDDELFWVEVSLKRAAIAGQDRIIAVVRDITERREAEKELRQRTHELGERVKELRCLHQITRASEDHDQPIEEMLQRITDVISVSWQWPRATTAVVELEGEVFESGAGEGPPVATQTAPIVVRGEQVGRVEVRYHEEFAEAAEGPFVDEERDLIDIIASTIAETIEHRRVEAERSALARFPDENPMPVLRASADGTVSYANEAAAELLAGLDSGVGQAAPEEWQSVARQSLESGENQRIQAVLDGQTFVLSCAPVPEQGYVNFYGMDITDRLAAEEALVESERRFRRAISQAPFPIMLHAEDGEVLTVNEVWLDITGYDASQLTTVGAWTELAYGEQMSAVGEHIGNIHRLDSAIDEGEFRIRTADGETRTWHFHSAPLGALPDGRRVTISMASDVTARTAAQKALRESERRYRTVFENTGAATCLIARDGTLTLVNEGYAELAAGTREEIEGQLKYSDFVAPHERERMTTYHIERRRPGGEAPTRYEFDFVDLEGEMHRVFLSIDVIPGTDTAVASLVDITQLREAQEALQALTEELEERVRRRTAELQAANQELEAFAYSVSHDLRAPLRAIDGFSQAVIEDYGEILDETGQDYLQRVRTASQRMGTLIDDILQLSRITRAELRPDRVDMSAMAAEIVEEMRIEDPDRSVEVVIESDLTADADRRLLRAALRNLMANAWKFTANEDQARIEFGSELDENGRHVYHVVDNGAGFDMEYANKLFQPFQRLHNEEQFAGTGVGLATVRRVISRHGGEVWAEGEPGEGASFYFTLRRSQGDDNDD